MSFNFFRENGAWKLGIGKSMKQDTLSNSHTAAQCAEKLPSLQDLQARQISFILYNFQILRVYSAWHFCSSRKACLCLRIALLFFLFELKSYYLSRFQNCFFFVYVLRIDDWLRIDGVSPKSPILFCDVANFPS